jgi:hypothetical protein
VIVEYKEPGNLSPNKDAANNKKVIEQLKKRFYDMRPRELMVAPVRNPIPSVML